MEELLANYQHVINEVKLITSSGGAFEVTVNDDLIYSKKTIQKRHAAPGEILSLFQEYVGPGVQLFPKQ